MHFAELERHIGSIGELRNIIGAMRSLAGIRVQEAQRALPAVRRYGQTVAEAVAAALSLVAEPPPKGGAQGSCGLVLFLAEHGFVGGFDERILAAAEAALASADVLFVLGSRGAARLAESGRTADWSYPIATRTEGLGEAVRQLTGELYRRIASGELHRVAVMFARHRQGGAEAIETRQLLPVQPRSPARPQSRMPPLHNLRPQALLEELIADHVFALLVEAAVESLASENAARFAAMEAAHDNISKRLDRLRQEARAARQDEITTELLELIGGSENPA